MAEHLYYPDDMKDVTLNCPKCKKPAELIKNYKIINECCPKCGYPMGDIGAHTKSW